MARTASELTPGEILVVQSLYPIGTALQQIRVNAWATELEYFTPSWSSLSWNATANGATGTGLLLTMDNSYAVWGIGSRVLISNTQTQDLSAFVAAMGSSAIAHRWFVATGSNANPTAAAFLANMSPGYIGNMFEADMNTSPVFTVDYLGNISGTKLTTTGAIELGNATDTTISRVSAGVVAVEWIKVPTISSTSTLTNKRVTKRVVSTTQSATPTINTDNGDIFTITGLAQAITSFTTNLSGTPVTGDMIMIQITDDGTARALTFGASFSATTVALPTTTVISKLLRVLFQWNGSTWACISSV